MFSDNMAVIAYINVVCGSQSLAFVVNWVKEYRTYGPVAAAVVFLAKSVVDSHIGNANLV
jgi:hypothetical protein